MGFRIANLDGLSGDPAEILLTHNPVLGLPVEGLFRAQAVGANARKSSHVVQIELARPP